MTEKEYNEFLKETNHLVEGKKQNEEPFFHTKEDEQILDKVWENIAKEKEKKPASVPERQTT